MGSLEKIFPFLILADAINLFAETPEVGGARGAYASLSFGVSVNPIRTKGGRLCPPYYYVPPIFLDDVASLSPQNRTL